MSAKKLKAWELREAGENGQTKAVGGGGGEGREGQRGGRSGLCKLIFPLFSFQLQIASESGLKYTHEFFDSFLHDRAKFSIF